MSKFLNIQCRLSRLKYPPFAKKWINIRKSYGNFYKVKFLYIIDCSALNDKFITFCFYGKLWFTRCSSQEKAIYFRSKFL